MTRCKLRIQFFLLTSVLLAGFAAFGFQTLYGLGKVKVGGPLYEPLTLTKPDPFLLTRIEPAVAQA